MSEIPQPETCDLNHLRRALTQRNQAIACAILSITLSLALIMNTFLDHHNQLKTAQAQVLELQKELSINQQALRDDQQALRQTEEALRREREALARVLSH